MRRGMLALAAVTTAVASLSAAPKITFTDTTLSVPMLGVPLSRRSISSSNCLLASFEFSLRLSRIIRRHRKLCANRANSRWGCRECAMSEEITRIGIREIINAHAKFCDFIALRFVIEIKCAHALAVTC